MWHLSCTTFSSAIPQGLRISCFSFPRALVSESSVSPTTVSVLGTYHSHAMLHKDGEIFPGLRLRTAHMVIHKSHLDDETEEPPHNLSPHHPISRLPSPVSATFAVFFRHFLSFLVSIKSRYLSLPNSYPCSRSIFFLALSIPPFHPGTPVTSTRPVPSPKEPILGPETVLGPNFPYLLLFLLPSHPILLVKERQYILSIHPANTKKLVHVELSSEFAPLTAYKVRTASSPPSSNKKPQQARLLQHMGDIFLGVHQHLQFSYRRIKTPYHAHTVWAPKSLQPEIFIGMRSVKSP